MQLSALAAVGSFSLTGLWPALLATFVFAALARWMRGVSRSGAVAGALVCFLLYACAGWQAFVLLAAVFLLTWAATHVGYERKQRLGTAEKSEGRKASQILANLGVAAGSAMLFLYSGGRPIFLAALVAALAEAATDTVSSEIGQAMSDQARMITNWKPVPAGTDGAVSWAGTLAGVVGAGSISLISNLTGLLPLRVSGIALLAAIIGTFCDSYLGAWLERRHLLNNDAVNLLSTLVAAAAAAVLVRNLQLI